MVDEGNETTEETPGSARRVVTLSENIEVLGEMLAGAQRDLAIFSRRLDRRLYDAEAIQEGVRKLATSGPFARIRILVMEPRRATVDGSQLIDLGRRLSSYIDMRRTHSDYDQIASEFVAVDGNAILYRPVAEDYDGVADTDDPSMVRQHMRLFEEAWAKSTSDIELRSLGI